MHKALLQVQYCSTRTILGDCRFKLDDLLQIWSCSHSTSKVLSDVHQISAPSVYHHIMRSKNKTNHNQLTKQPRLLDLNFRTIIRDKAPRRRAPRLRHGSVFGIHFQYEFLVSILNIYPFFGIYISYTQRTCEPTY